MNPSTASTLDETIQEVTDWRNMMNSLRCILALMWYNCLINFQKFPDYLILARHKFTIYSVEVNEIKSFVFLY